MKGYSDFLELSKRLDDSYQIILVGLNDEQIKLLPNNILGIKRTSSIRELVCIYSASDIFLNLSYCENYPTVNLEANACGLCVLTYDTGGSPESILGPGYVIPKGNLDAVVEKINDIKGRECKCDVNAEVYDLKKAIKLYVRNYEDRRAE